MIEPPPPLGAARRALRGWLLGQVVSMSLVGVLTGIGLRLLGVPLVLSLSVLAGLPDFIPFIGPVIAAVPAVLMAATVGPSIALYTVLLYIVVQQIEGNVIQPLVQRWAVALPPALGLIAVVAFGTLFGVLGLVFAVPLAVALRALVQKLYVDRIESQA